jgi:hypothetical protein
MHFVLRPDPAHDRTLAPSIYDSGERVRTRHGVMNTQFVWSGATGANSARWDARRDTHFTRLLEPTRPKGHSRAAGPYFQQPPVRPVAPRAAVPGVLSANDAGVPPKRCRAHGVAQRCSSASNMLHAFCVSIFGGVEHPSRFWRLSVLTLKYRILRHPLGPALGARSHSSCRYWSRRSCNILLWCL